MFQHTIHDRSSQQRTQGLNEGKAGIGERKEGRKERRGEKELEEDGYFGVKTRHRCGPRRPCRPSNKKWHKQSGRKRLDREPGEIGGTGKKCRYGTRGCQSQSEGVEKRNKRKGRIDSDYTRERKPDRQEE